MKKIMVVFGTRPEAIKMCPVVLELQANTNYHIIVCVTGQHREMLEQVLNIFHVKPDYNLHVMKERQDLFDVTCNVLHSIKPVLKKESPDLVLVHGDTTTTFGTALACFYLSIPVGHVEAGLRTYDMNAPFPEEFNRQMVSKVSEIHFAPTSQARDNLLKETIPSDKIIITGNTVIDALQYTVQENYETELMNWVGENRLILLTAHRRENLGEPMKNIFRAVRKIVEEFPDVRVVYPIHMNPAIREIADEILQDQKNIRIIAPLDVNDFHNVMKRSYIILTDSGGVQEEAPAFGIPVLVLRDTTERPEGIKAGTLQLVGTDEKVIYQKTSELLTNHEMYQRMSTAVNPYGDGTASRKIRECLEKMFDT